MIFLFGCTVSYQTLRTKTTIQDFPVFIQQEDLPLQYQKAKTKPIKDQKNKQITDSIWTISPYPRPNTMMPSESFTIPIEIQTVSKPSFDQTTTLQIMKPKSVQKDVYGQKASISGPTERVSSDLIILRTQLYSSNGGDIVTWRSSITPAPCPIQMKNFICTPPKYTIEHSQQHTSTLDSFSYTQLALHVSPLPVPVYIRTTIDNTQKTSEHQALIHPSSVYIGISIPYWTQVDQSFSVQTQIVETNGTLGQAKAISIHLVGSSTVQTCTKEPCSFKPNRTGWHQVIATATDYQGRKTQSTGDIFVYGKNKTNQAEILLHPEKKEILVQGAKEHTDLMLGYLSDDEIFLDSHSITSGFIIQESDSDIDRAKALLIGSRKTELVLDPLPPQIVEDTQSTKSAALLFDNSQVSYPRNMYLNDKSTIYILLPPGPAFTLKIKSENQHLHFEPGTMLVEKRSAPSLLKIPFEARTFGTDHIVLQTEKRLKKYPINIRASINQKPHIQYGVLQAQKNIGARLSIPAGHYSIGTDTHAEHRLLQYVFPYLYKVPTTQNRIERIQVVSQSWDALYHSQESYALSLLEQAKLDIEYGQNHWREFHKQELLDWLHTLVVMNQSALYVPTEHVVHVYKAIQKITFSNEQQAFLFFILARAQKTPLKGLLPQAPKKDIQHLFSKLSDIDRIWLIPALEKDNPTRHWTYSNYEKIKKLAPERVMMAFFRMREYRYRIRYLREVTPLDTHNSLLAQLQHARDRRLNRYSIHTFLWDNDQIIERGGHRRRVHHPIVKQGSTTKEKTLLLTTKGEGKLRYTLSTRPTRSSTTPKGSYVKQSYEENEQGTFLNITFDAPEKGIYWITDQIPSGIALTIEKADWLFDIQLIHQELLIKTKEIEPGRYNIKIPAHKKYAGTYQDPSVRVGLGEKWIAQSENSNLVIK
ncbi:MAG: hypothetical protein CL916_00610 [Deltaproteobacteria bacterium]|nr:hypothetical protein [Deltaproteobacteria bacterium]